MHEMTANYHTHTVRCHHAIGTEREYIETAIARGLKILGFADHSPQLFPGDYYSNFRMYPEQAENYVSTLRRLRDEYKNDIDILIGFETEYYPEIFERLIEFLAPYDIDYMILGQHFIDNEYDTSIYSGFSTSDESRLERYTNAVLEGLSTGKFSYVAHPDEVNRVGLEYVDQDVVVDDDLVSARTGGHHAVFAKAREHLISPLKLTFSVSQPSATIHRSAFTK